MPTKVFGDERRFFAETYRREEWADRTLTPVSGRLSGLREWRSARRSGRQGGGGSSSSRREGSPPRSPAGARGRGVDAQVGTPAP